MNFKDFYKSTPRYSFEVFPPKTPEGADKLLKVLDAFRPYKPAFVSVTYGAMGSTRDLTRDLTLTIKDKLGYPVAFHFTCVGSGRAEITEYVTRLRESGIDLVVALRGDPPPGGTFQKPADGFAHANELVAFLNELGGVSMAVAGYPEGHVECVDLKADLDHLKRKVDAGADLIISQLFFDNNDYFNFVDRARKAGISQIMIPGIMPIASLAQVEKIASMCGAKIPKALHEKLSKNPEHATEIGVEHAMTQCQGLLKEGVPGIHFYTLNRSESVLKVLSQI